MSNDSKLITVYIPKNKAEQLVIEALLNSAEIESFTLNAGVQSLIGASALFNVGAGAIEIQVKEDDAEKAIKLINSK
tara:strand:+ start:1813 stop:2043 length:231 start_codon:yes stop_codon:yes gene_type:complete